MPFQSCLFDAFAVHRARCAALRDGSSDRHEMPLASVTLMCSPFGYLHRRMLDVCGDLICRSPSGSLILVHKAPEVIRHKTATEGSVTRQYCVFCLVFQVQQG